MTFGGNENQGGSKKKKVAIISVSSLILVAMVVAVTVGVTRNHNGSGSGSNDNNNQISSSTKAIKTMCQPTHYKETCEESLTKAAANTTDPKELIKAGFQVAIDSVKEAIKNSTTLNELVKEPRDKMALDDCRELMDLSIDELKNSLTKLADFEFNKLDEYVSDLRSWLTAAMTTQETCLDGFENSTSKAGEKMKSILKTAMELTSNGLVMVTEISSVLSAMNIPGISRRLMAQPAATHIPAWVVTKQAVIAAPPPPNVVVAKDGSGKYNNINQALLEIPKNNQQTFVIYVKAGVYDETVLFTKHMTNVMLIGDGPTETKITGRKNVIDGVSTYNSATVAVMGANFIGVNIGFENTAGPLKHQAVALRVQADYAIFYNCQMDGYQDTLYTHYGRQFYRDCTISGTIDFIFGNAAAIFQNCKIVVRKPVDDQACMVTAQGRVEPHQDGVIVLLNCHILGDPAYLPFKAVNKAYLGRPWKMYSRTIVMQSQIDDLIQPEGWFPWQGTFALDTLFYAEYGNKGTGAGLARRVTWPGIKKLTPEQALGFTPGKMYMGDFWIKSSGVPYTSGF